MVLILFVFSVVLPFVAYKARPPRYLTNRDLQIASFQEPFQIQVAERKTYQIASLDNPFYLKEERLGKTERENEQKSLFVPPLSLLYRGKEKYVAIGEEILKEGERVGEFEVVTVLDDRVLIKDKKGQKKWLKLENF